MGLLESIPTHMDFHGQKLAEQIFQAVIVVFAAVGFVWGYYCEQFVQTIYILGAGFALSCVCTFYCFPEASTESLCAVLHKKGIFIQNELQLLQLSRSITASTAVSCLKTLRKTLALTLPPWPIYRRNPVSWQKVVDKSEVQETSSGKKKRKERSK